jgi:hypothetical protein
LDEPIIRKNSVGGMVNVYGNLFMNFEGKLLLGRPRHKWEDNIKMSLKDIVYEGGID